MPTSRAGSSSIKTMKKPKKVLVRTAQQNVFNPLFLVFMVSLDHRRVAGADNSDKPEALFGIR
jgi:hypothetical protein